MNWLKNIPIWGWWIFTVALCYAIWNPSEFSVYHFLRYSDADISVKALVVLLIGGLKTIYFLQTWRTFRPIGITIMALIIFAGLWSLQNLGLPMIGAEWWGQIIVGSVMTLGLQGSRIYRDLTGVTTVVEDVHVHH